MFTETAIDGGCIILFVLDQVISGPRWMFSRPQEDLDPGLSVKKAEVPLPRLRGARPSTGLGSATAPAPTAGGHQPPPRHHLEKAAHTVHAIHTQVALF